MGKISPVSAKYIVHANIQIEGTVDKPDIIGAVFGQTEGLLGEELELRELQKSGRIGRIEVNSEIKAGKTDGLITIPSSLDKTETVIIAAAMETIQRIGPCNAKVKILKVEDVRTSKRTFVIQRAKELLKSLTQDVLPDSQEITAEVANSVRMMEIIEYGKDRLPAGPGIAESEEVIIVEGRADVLTLLRNGFKNVIALNGTSVPQTVIDLSKTKTTTLFVDGDRGGDLIIKEATSVAEIDYVAKAPDGKEVEELTQKEIHKGLRGKVAAEQAKHEIKDVPKRNGIVRTTTYQKPVTRTPTRPLRTTTTASPILTTDQREKFKKMLEDLIGTRGAYILDTKLSILGKVPSTELATTIRSLNSGIFAVVFDGTVTSDITTIAERANISYIVAMDSTIKAHETKVKVLTKTTL
ncbi:MAG: DNA primase DnaG [archaeon]